MASWSRATTGRGGVGAPAPPAPKYGEVFIPKNVVSAYDSTGYPAGYHAPPFYIRGRDTTVHPLATPETYHMIPTRQTAVDIIFLGVPGRGDRNIIIKKPWNRYFIYEHLSLPDHKSIRMDSYYGPGGGGSSGLFTPTVGMIVDNHGQVYKFGIKSTYGPDSDKTDINIAADPSLPPLTNAQIDYVKKQAEALGYSFPGVNAAEMKALFGDDTARADHARCMEGAARIREQLAQREEELRTARAERDALQTRINTATRSFANFQARRAAEREVPGVVTYNRNAANASVGNPSVIVNPPNANGNPQGGGARKTRRNRARRAKTIKRKYNLQS